MIIQIHRRSAAPAIDYLFGHKPKNTPILVNGDLDRYAKAVSQFPLAVAIAWEEPLIESPDQLRRVAVEFTRMMHEEMGSGQTEAYFPKRQGSQGDKGKGGGL